MSKNNWQNYFGEDTKVYIFKCTKCKFEDPVPDWLLDEFGGFSLLNKKTPKKNFKMTCPKCGGNVELKYGTGKCEHCGTNFTTQFKLQEM